MRSSPSSSSSSSGYVGHSSNCLVLSPLAPSRVPPSVAAEPAELPISPPSSLPPPVVCQPVRRAATRLSVRPQTLLRSVSVSPLSLSLSSLRLEVDHLASSLPTHSTHSNEALFKQPQPVSQPCSSPLPQLSTRQPRTAPRSTGDRTPRFRSSDWPAEGEGAALEARSRGEERRRDRPWVDEQHGQHDTT